MLAWYHALDVSGVLYKNGIPWQSSFFGASPGGFCSLGYDITAGILKVCDPRFSRALVYI